MVIMPITKGVKMRRIIKQELPEIECQKCGYIWTPRKENPKSCPECKSRDWKKEELQGGLK